MNVTSLIPAGRALSLTRALENKEDALTAMSGNPGLAKALTVAMDAKS